MNVNQYILLLFNYWYRLLLVQVGKTFNFTIKSDIAGEHREDFIFRWLREEHFTRVAFLIGAFY